MNSDARQVLTLAQMIKAGLPTDHLKLELSEESTSQLNRLKRLNSEIGGPIAPVLERFAKVLSQRAVALEELDIAAAGPKASTTLVMSLPILVLIGAAISGIPIWRAITRNAFSWIAILLGLGLFWVGRNWTKTILRNAEPNRIDPAFPIELVILAVSAGMPLRSACERAGVDPESMQLDANGMATIPLLVELANQLRTEQSVADRKRIQKSSVAVLWPLGLTVLPAFVLVAIVPIAIALVIS